ncbi:MAG: dihydrofolate reductase [Flavobacteriales bacterium]|jgi:dihydrofolate reductase|nr:dihydrofolate reductase [Flavobacteriales bacterium]
MKIALIAALARNGAIGKDNRLLWHLPDDMKFFKGTTAGHHILTGRKNYESIPMRYRPLPDRVNLVISRQAGYHAPGAHVFSDIARAIEFACEAGEDELMVIGGGEIYKRCLPLAQVLYLTHVEAAPEGDTYLALPDPENWHIELLHVHPADATHAYAFRIERWERFC